MKNVAADSGPLVALFNRTDKWHGPVLEWFKSHPKTQIITTWPVVTEVCALLARRIGNAAALDFLLWIERGGIALDTPAPTSFHSVLVIAQKYDDLPLDLVDASIAELAGRLAIEYVLTIDSDFDVYRDARGRALKNALQSTAKK